MMSTESITRSAVTVTPEHPAEAADQKISWQPRSSLLRIRVFAVLLLIDLVTISACFLIAAEIRGIVSAETGWLVFLLTMLPIYFTIAIILHAYAPSSFVDPAGMAIKGVKALSISIGAMILIAFYLKSSQVFPRAAIAIGTVSSLTILFAARYLAILYMARIVGGNPFSVVLIREFDQPMPTGAYSVMISAETFFDPERHDPVMYDRLARSLGSADRVVIACRADRRIAWARALKGANIQSEIIVSELTALAPLGIGKHGSEPTIVVATGPLDLFDRFVKRAFDLLIAGLAVL
jgi:hypothetical protein